MVLTQKVGKERPFGLVVLLYVVTFGIYGIYWHYKAHSEVYKQFELAKEGKDEGIVWLILGLVLFQPLLWVYQWMFVSNVRYVRERLGFRKNLSGGGFLGLSIPGGILFAIGLVLIFFGIALAGAAQDAEQDLTPQERDDLEALGGMLAIIGAVLFIVGLALQLTAYGKLQGNMNELWRAYDRRMGQLGGPGSPGRPPAAVPAGTPPPSPSQPTPWEQVPPNQGGWN